MLKIVVKVTVSVLILFVFSGCVKRDVPLVVEHKNVEKKHDVNDVDTSDLDKNLTESETVMTENSDEKMKRIAFPTSEYYSLPRTGRGTVKGQIYLTDVYGSKVVGGGTRLYLNPITSYSRQWYVESYLGGNRMQKADARLFNYLKFTAADSNGNFAFYGVPDGSYYLIGTVKCGEECGYSDLKSIRIATRVSVQGNQIVQKDLTRTAE